MNQSRYRVLGPLHAGEGSRAALGLQIAPDGVPSPVVLVFAPPEVNTDKEAAQRLARETERAVLLEHPHILRVFGLTVLPDADRQSLARVTEFADGESLRRILEVAKTLTSTQAALIVADIAMGVHYAHMAGNDDGSPLVHGDLRPETVMVSFSGITKVTGYGALSVAPREVNGRRVVNRRKYSAPEQVVSGRAAVIVQSDVFLLGLMLHESLTGEQPFANAEDHDQAILTQPLSPLPEHLPEALAKVIQRATAKKATDRFPTALAMREAIVEAVGELPTHEELASFLAPLFPDLEGIRAKRKHLIDSGIASYAKEQWATRSTQPEVAAVPPPAAITEPETPVAVAPPPVPPAPRRQVREDRDALTPPPLPQKSSFAVPIIVGLGTAAIAIGAFVYLQRDPAPQPVAAVVEDAGTNEVAAAPPVIDAGAVAAVEPIDAGVAEPEKPQLAELELNVDPPVNVTINGEERGRAPLKMNLQPGKYVVNLSDKGRGIQTSRTVVVSASGTSQSIYLQKGFVSVSAPDGSSIYIDGKKVGVAPLKDISVYEGSHRILVTVGKAKWSQAFTVAANERMYFEVELNEP